MQFVYRFWYLFTFYEYKQTNVNNSQLAEFAKKNMNMVSNESTLLEDQEYDVLFIMFVYIL